MTVVPTSGLGYISIWPTGATQPVVSTLNDFQATVVANAAIVPAGTNGAISVYVTDQTNVVIDVNGYFIASTSLLNFNTALGLGSLPVLAGSQNTAVGAGAIGNNVSGNYNTGVGTGSLQSNSTGSQNTAVGQGALAANTTGSSNTAVGYQTLASTNSQSNNLAIGDLAMTSATGSSNTAIGINSLAATSGNNNIALGFQAGSTVSAGGNNIEIGNTGIAADTGVIRIGTQGTQTQTFIAGVAGVNVTGGATVVVNANGQIGVSSSSRRYKEDIRPMADDSDRLMDLQPVSFRYKPEVANGSENRQYGLIAEDVAAVYPELAVYNQSGQVETLQYQQLPAMLLNEIQKQRKTIDELQARLAALEQQLKAQSNSAKR